MREGENSDSPYAPLLEGGLRPPCFTDYFAGSQTLRELNSQ